MAFRDLKQNRQQQLEKIADQFAKNNTSEAANDDDRFWYPDVDKAGNGLSTIRFLPTPDGEDSPSVRLFTRSFQGPTGKWYIENCLTTIGQDDPVNDLNRKLVNGMEWAQVPDKVKEVVRKQKRKEVYISNIYVIKDNLHPENEGKVFLFKYGKKIRDMINEKMNPSFEGEQRINPFDLWEGANFKIKISKVDKYRNYDKSSFEAQGPLFVNKAGEPDDERMEAVYNSEYKLATFIAPDQFKPREVLEAKLNAVLGNTGRVKIDEEIDEPKVTAPKAGKVEKPAWEGEDEIDEKFFENLDNDE